jgi:phosphinothricin acetyltransferase
MIRPATLEDAPQVAAIYGPFCEGSCVSFESRAPDPAEMAARIGRTTGCLPWLVEESAGQVLGYAYASPHRERAAYRWVVEVSVYVHELHRGRGVGRALYRDLLGRLRDQGFYKAYAGILVPNPPSQAFHESLGFTLVGIYRGVGYKLGAWRDVGWWQYVLRPESADPAEPLAPYPMQAAQS